MSVINIGEGFACDCCIVMISNGDESGCRDYHGHTHPTANAERAGYPGATVVPGGSGPFEPLRRGACDLCGRDEGAGTAPNGIGFLIDIKRPEWDELRTQPEFMLKINNVLILVEAAGGGTVGQRYAGSWRVEVQDGDKSFWCPSATGTPWTHQQVADMVADEYEFDPSNF